MKAKQIVLFICLGFVSLLSTAQDKADVTPVTIEVDASANQGAFQPIWNWFGYDEPNYTYMRDGSKLLKALSAIGKDKRTSPIYIRTHNLLTTGDGSAARKWGSTNAYTEDENGKPVYDWSIVDRIFDSYVNLGMKPVAEIGFMPQALSIKPEPYKHDWVNGGELWTGWAYPPKDYLKWSALVYEWVKHSIERYGVKEVETWLWEPWNEPNIGYWQGTYEEFLKLYDYTAMAVKRACATCKVGGPHTTNPDAPEAAAFLRNFLRHCAEGKNYASGEIGSPLDFIAFHAKGSPKLVDGHIRMNMSPQLNAVKTGFEIVANSAFKDLPVLIGEFDPEGCAACSIQEHPQYAYRNGLMYPSYTAASQARLYELAKYYNINFLGALTWGFEFENENWFDGFRDLATNGVDKPVLNLFRMYGEMPEGERLAVVSSRKRSAQDIIANGIYGEDSDIGAIASRGEKSIAILVWNYHDDDLPASNDEVKLLVKNIAASHVQISHYRIDKEHSNSFEVWKKMGSPQNPTEKQYSLLQEAGALDMMGQGTKQKIKNGTLDLHFALPRHAVSLVVLKTP